MQLRFTAAFDASDAADTFLQGLTACPAVFALFPSPREGVAAAPYLGRTRDLRRRLARLLSARRPISKILNLRDWTARVEYQPVGSAFEATWLLYRLNQHYFADEYRERLRLKPPALLKLKLRNRFPSLAAAERFAGEFLDFFRIRRCAEELNPDPSHPGCIYSQLKMCLAPCFAGCTDAEYQAEVQRTVNFLDSQGRGLLRELEDERTQASEALQFEQASKIHHRIEKLNEVLRQKGDLARDVRALHAVMVLPGAEAKCVTFFRIVAGEVHGPAALSLDENAPNPIPLDRQLHELMSSLCPTPEQSPALPNWEHLSLIARWYYSTFREGELVMLDPAQTIPHTRLIRLCRKLLAR